MQNPPGKRSLEHAGWRPTGRVFRGCFLLITHGQEDSSRADNLGPSWPYAAGKQAFVETLPTPNGYAVHLTWLYADD